jgi:N-methylhydantoinase B/oxoprolinase/acetone carboxylase alpha subunit
MKWFHPVLTAGDAFLHNSPYHGNSHAGDICVIAPVAGEDGNHRFSVLVKAHVADCGNSQPTTLMPKARVASRPRPSHCDKRSTAFGKQASSGAQRNVRSD